MNRRDLLILGTSGLIGAASLAAAPLLLRGRGLTAWAQNVDVEAVLNDPEAPVAGNPKGDVTIVNYFDYNCPYCKKSTPDLERIVKEDGKVRLVYKDWPILAESSIYGAQLALAAKYQGKYHQVHTALMKIEGRKVPRETMLAAVQKVPGVDQSRLQADLKANSEKILTLLRRNNAQAEALGIQGTPTYLIGPFRTSTLDYAGFKEALVEARRRQAAGKRK